LMQNILTIDVEDWYQTQSYRSKIKVSDWDILESRLDITLEILEILRQHKAKATFFILAYNAKRHPDIVRLIAEEGHELGVHGYYHNPVYLQTPLQFQNEVGYSKKLIEDLCQTKVIGFRAPNWSITLSCLWALDILRELGFYYDSSMSESIFKKTRNKIPHELLEIPRSSFRFMGIPIPFAGGGSLRAYPYFATRKLMQQKNKKGHKVVVYIHPWECDRNPPQAGLAFSKRLMKDFNLGSTKEKLGFLLKDFEFNSIRNLYYAALNPRP